MARVNERMEEEIIGLRINAGDIDIRIRQEDVVCTVENGSVRFRTVNGAVGIQRLPGWMEGMQRLFGGEVGQLNICVSMLPHLTAEFLELMPVCKELRIIWNRRFEPHPQDFRRLLDGIQIKESLVLYCDELRVDTAEVYDLDYLTVTYSSWITLHEFMMLHNRFVFLASNETPENEMNEYLKQFVMNPEDRLEVLVVNRGYPIPPWNEEEVLRGINTFHWNPRRRNRRFFHPKSGKMSHRIGRSTILFPSCLEWGLDMGNAHDFVKENGTLCSILFEYDALIVVVWKDPFPNRKFVDQLNGEIVDCQMEIEKNRTHIAKILEARTWSGPPSALAESDEQTFHQKNSDLTEKIEQIQNKIEHISA